MAGSWLNRFGSTLKFSPKVIKMDYNKYTDYHNTFLVGFLETFPYFLPSAASVFLLLIGLVIIYFFLPETRYMRTIVSRSVLKSYVLEALTCLTRRA